MRRLVLMMVLIIFFSPSINADEGGYTAQFRFDIPNPEPVSTIFEECFIELDLSDNCSHDSDSITLSWWLWSDQTNSDWPDDDAKSRSGIYNLSSNSDFESVSFFNQYESKTNAIENYSKIDSSMPIIDLAGEIIIVEGETGPWYIRMPIEMTPTQNLTDDTLLYIFLSKQNAIDMHGRVSTNLIYDMKPEVGFGIKANNTTSAEWIISSEHLYAAGIDFEEDPYGWQITMAFFGSIESDNSSEQLLSMHHFDLPFKSQNIDSTALYLPILIFVLLAIICFGLVSQSYRNEKGMPKISAGWKDDVTLIIDVQSFQKRVEVKSVKIEAPWKMRNNPKSRFIEPNQLVNIEIKVKQKLPDNCNIGIQLEVDELGSWTQYLALNSPTVEK
ncbi:MAG: hypothetical protein CBE08_006715 [Euryarchaeota archaeon TMED248]|nr:MAG: hypothetical protein CBE08_006715 [Euryarchaeota archaeon TMED248]